MVTVAQGNSARKPDEAMRLPPQNLEAEMSVLGAIICDPSIVAEAMPMLDRAERFYFDAHQHIFRAMIDLYTTSRAIDVVTLAEQLRRRGQLENAGGPAYLAEILALAPTAANWRDHANIVRATWSQRRVLHITNAMARDIHDGQDIAAVLERGQRAFAEVASTAGGLSENPLQWPAPKFASELTGTAADLRYVWFGCIALGHITLFSALMKAGKSTFLSLLLLALQTGRDFLGRRVMQGRTLYVSEESEQQWTRRRDLLGLDDSLSIMSKPMLVKPTFAEWCDFIDEIKRHAEQRGCTLIVIDTLSAFAPWDNENDNAAIMQAMTPLNRLTKSGFAVLLVHHVGKLDQSEGRAARGGSALPGAVDVILELRRLKSDDISDRCRVLSGLGRFDEIPEQLVIELDESGTQYTARGDKKQMAAAALDEEISAVLPSEPPGLKVDEVHTAMDSLSRPQRSGVAAALRRGADAGKWASSGTGKRLDPMRYWRK